MVEIHPELSAALSLIEARLNAERENRNLAAVSAGVVIDQDLIWHKGFGYANLERQIPADENTIYRVASITKLFTSTMLVMLRDAGKLHLDDPIEQYLPTFRIKSSFADARPATFRQVASHGSGLPREGSHQGWKTATMPSIEELLECLGDEGMEMRLPAVLEPKYSNLGIAIMGYALSQIAAQPYHEYVDRHILQRLGMVNSGFLRDQLAQDHLAVGYFAAKGQHQVAPIWDENGFRPAGGMYSSVADISRFIALQFRDDAAGSRPDQILGGTSLREMHMPVTVSSDFESGYGLGWGIRRIVGQKVIGHSGGLPGYTTNITLVPGLKLAAVAFTNGETVSAELSQMMLEILIPVMKRQKAQAVVPPTPEEIESWTPYTGRYHWMDDSITEIRVIKNKLYLIDMDNPTALEVSLVPHSPGKFKIVGGPIHSDFIIFETDASGRVTGLVMGGYPLTRIGDL